MCDMIEFAGFTVLHTEKALREKIPSEYIVPRSRDRKWAREGCDPDGCLCHIDVLETLQLAKPAGGFCLNRFGVYVVGRPLKTQEKVLEYDIFGLITGKANCYSITVTPHADLDPLAFAEDHPVKIYRPKGHIIKVQIRTPFDQIQQNFNVFYGSDLAYELEESPGRIYFVMKTISGRPWNGC